LLPTLPLDPIDGSPLRSRLNDDGTFLLYSIGIDGVDDHGDAASTWRNPSVATGRDVVWPHPPTPEEIEAFLTKSSSPGP
jgi:hypothetical protein